MQSLISILEQQKGFETKGENKVNFFLELSDFFEKGIKTTISKKNNTFDFFKLYA